LECYLPAVYDTSTPLPPDHRRRRFRQEPAEAVARLTYLARASGDSVSWWSLRELVRGWSQRSGTVAVVAIIVTAGLFNPPWFWNWAGATAWEIAGIAMLIGFIAPASCTSTGQDRRYPLGRSVLRTALPIAAVVLVMDVVSLGLPTTLIDGHWPSLAYLLQQFIVLSFGCPVAYEAGRCMRALSAMGRPHDRGLIRRTAEICALLGLVVLGQGLLFGGGFWSVTTVATAFLMAVACIAAQAFLPAGGPRPAGDGTMPRLRGIVRAGVPAAIAAAASMAVGMLFEHSSPIYLLLYMAQVGLPAGLTVGTLTVYDESPASPARRNLQPVVRAAFAGILVCVVVTAVLTTGMVADGEAPADVMLFASTLGALAGTVMAVLVVVPSYLATPARDLDRTEPRRALRRDRRAALVIIAGAVLNMMLNPLHSPFRLGMTMLILLLLPTQSRWPAYIGARILLTVDRVLPWRVMEFLADAHDRGVLRRVGSVYQFRHQRIRESIASRAS
jgi:hypothetical protein